MIAVADGQHTVTEATVDAWQLKPRSHSFENPAPAQILSRKVFDYSNFRQRILTERACLHHSEHRSIRAARLASAAHAYAQRGVLQVDRRQAQESDGTRQGVHVARLIICTMSRNGIECLSLSRWLRTGLHSGGTSGAHSAAADIDAGYVGRARARGPNRTGDAAGANEGQHGAGDAARLQVAGTRRISLKIFGRNFNLAPIPRRVRVTAVPTWQQTGRNNDGDSMQEAP